MKFSIVNNFRRPNLAAISFSATNYPERSVSVSHSWRKYKRRHFLSHRVTVTLTWTQ